MNWIYNNLQTIQPFVLLLASKIDKFDIIICRPSKLEIQNSSSLLKKSTSNYVINDFSSNVSSSHHSYTLKFVEMLMGKTIYAHPCSNHKTFIRYIYVE